MPLVLMCGFPCSGKSLRTQQLRDFFQVKESVQVVTSDEERSLRNSVFADSRRETQLRGELKSEVIRLLSKEQLVILDSANYIKGFRYELYCLSKSVKTTHCLIHTDTAVDTCWQWNSQRPHEEQYSKEIFDGLVQEVRRPRYFPQPGGTVRSSRSTEDEELAPWTAVVGRPWRGRDGPPSPNVGPPSRPTPWPVRPLTFLYRPSGPAPPSDDHRTAIPTKGSKYHGVAGGTTNSHVPGCLTGKSGACHQRKGLGDGGA
uniref:Protein KTI12 homolog n=1 Tax=Ixodes ricinus TaxID=34613 RepID=A0A0K8R2S6_IXORI